MQERISAAGNLDEFLSAIGIECNRVDGEWTGVSLSRYKQLVASLIISTRAKSALAHEDWSFSLLLRFVWEKSKTKHCLLKFAKACDASATPIPILLSNLRISNDKWCKMEFDSLKPFRIGEKHSNMLIRCFNRDRNAFASIESSDITGAGDASALEELAAFVASERNIKPAIKLGRYKYGPFSVSKPDCVEVVLREVMDYLLFGMLYCMIQFYTVNCFLYRYHINFTVFIVLLHRSNFTTVVS